MLINMPVCLLEYCKISLDSIRLTDGVMGVFAVVGVHHRDLWYDGEERARTEGRSSINSLREKDCRDEDFIRPSGLKGKWAGDDQEYICSNGEEGDRERCNIQRAAVKYGWYAKCISQEWRRWTSIQRPLPIYHCASNANNSAQRCAPGKI